MVLDVLEIKTANAVNIIVASHLGVVVYTAGLLLTEVNRVLF
jgi:hypothetical protein